MKNLHEQNLPIVYFQLGHCADSHNPHYLRYYKMWAGGKKDTFWFQVSWYLHK